MRSYEEYKQILELWEQGYNQSEISRMTELPRGTVRDCIKRFGSVKFLDEFMHTSQFPTPDELRGVKRKRIKPQYSPRETAGTDEDLRKYVAESESLAQVLSKLGLRPAGGNYLTIKRRIQKLDLDTSHFLGQGWLKGKSHSFSRKQALEDILVKDSTYTNTRHLKNRLLRAEIFEPRCQSCELDTWLEQPIPLELDHINGDRRDHRRENLRLLCPNCHALTPTYRGKNIGNG